MLQRAASDYWMLISSGLFLVCMQHSKSMKKMHAALKINEENAENSFDQFFQITETLLDTCGPIDKLSRKKTKVNAKALVNKRNNDIC